jgi:hypothetical protein
MGEAIDGIDGIAVTGGWVGEDEAAPLAAPHAGNSMAVAMIAIVHRRRPSSTRPSA